jgi:hypothetical protein
VRYWRLAANHPAGTRNDSQRLSYESGRSSPRPRRAEQPKSRVPPPLDSGLPWGEGALPTDSGFFHHPCFTTRLGGVSGGKETQGWRDSSHTAMVGAGKSGSAKLPMATAMYPGKPSFSQ